MRNKFFFRLLVAFVAAMGLCGGLHAQRYETDALLADSVTFQPLKSERGVFSIVKKKVMVPNGMVVEFVRDTVGDMVVVRYNGEEYAVSSGDLRFGKNESGVENLIQGKAEQRKHSFIGHMFYGSFPYILIFVVLVATGLCMLLVNKVVKREPLVTRLLVAVPCGLMLTSLMELWAYLTIGTDIGWWCDPGRQSIGHALLMAAPLTIALAIQVLVGMSYKRYVDSVAEVEVPWKPMVWGVGLFIPVSFLILFLLSVLPMGEFLRDFLSVVLLLCTVGACFGYSFYRIVKVLGRQRAMLFVFFSFVYAVSLVVAAIAFFIIALKIILMVVFYFLVIAAAIYLLGLAGGWARKKKPENEEENKEKIVEEKKQEDETIPTDKLLN